MDVTQIQDRFHKLQRLREQGQLEAESYHFEVAKLAFRDPQGAYWMIDADSGEWFCNRGEGWQPGDPTAGPPPGRPLVAGRSKDRLAGRLLLLAASLVALLAVAGWWALQQGFLPNPLASTPTATASLQVTIASPADGSHVTLGQEIAIESTIGAQPDLQPVSHVQLTANDQVVHSQAVRPRLQPEQTSLPLSQPWRPTVAGDYRIAVTALSDEGQPLGSAEITLQVVEDSAGALPEPACTRDATFVTDVTIAPGTAFPPGARMEKVWQVRNSGTCAWGTGYDLVRVDGEALGAPGRLAVPPTAAGETVDLIVISEAPQMAGAYDSVWQIQAPDGEFFGPRLILAIEVEAQAEESSPPAAPTDLAATLQEDGKGIRLSWVDWSDDEDAFRIYREDVEASIGLAPANTLMFVDENIVCGHTYRYAVVAFNAAGPSPISEAVEITLPPCAPPDTAPSLSLTVVPTQVLASETFTIAFEASDDLGVELVIVWGEKSGEPALDMGRIFTCTETLCSASWPITLPLEFVVSRLGESDMALTILAIARDASGQQSDLARTTLQIIRSE